MWGKVGGHGDEKHIFAYYLSDWRVPSVAWLGGI